jgi:hypothetical protein
MSQKITTITINVPYKSSGGVINQRPVTFELFHLDGHYSLKPCLDVSQRQVANLPEELPFKMEEGKPVSLRGKFDGNFHVITDAVAALKEANALPL